MSIFVTVLQVSVKVAVIHTNFILQLLKDPYFLFCDEITTGLDSYNAGIVIEKLRQLSSQGKAIVCTIHQPQSGIFELFTHVLIVAGGRTAYHGDILGAKLHFDRYSQYFK